MTCPNCGSPSWSPEGACSNCRYFVAQPRRASFGSRRPALLITLSLSLAGGIVAAGVSGYLLLKRSGFIKAFQEGMNRTKTGGRRRGLPVRHGRIAHPEELHGHGQLYFVPVGRQAIPVQSLADYYSQKFGIKITVLPDVEVRPSDCVPARRQCAVEELEAEMTTAYGDIARDPNSVMIALTDEDIFPRDWGWDFTYSWHSARIGIVSTRRMNPGFWGGAPDTAFALASTRQMLTKYIAIQYFHVPESLDPSSVMYTPLTPNGGPDEIYESDLQPEATVNGRRGTPYACLYFTYSYETHTITADNPVLSDCRYGNPVSSPSEETFQTNLGVGYLTQRAMDLQLDSTPPIVYRRGFNSGYSSPRELGLGWSTGHSFNSYLTSDGYEAQTHINVLHEDGSAEYFARLDRSRGFDPHYVFQSSDVTIYGARLTWDSGHYRLQYRDGAVSTFLPCDTRAVLCYWTGYQDAQGNSLRLDRTSDRDLTSVAASDGQAISFRYNDRHQIIDAQASSGNHVSYEYDDHGCLAAVHRVDGTVALYGYDTQHHMTSFSVLRPGATSPELVLFNEYDKRGRVVEQMLAGVGSYSIEYLAEENGYASALKITDPTGHVFEISSGQNDYIVRTTPIKFDTAPGR